jgi:hypothetical protein
MARDAYRLPLRSAGEIRTNKNLKLRLPSLLSLLLLCYTTITLAIATVATFPQPYPSQDAVVADALFLVLRSWDAMRIFVRTPDDKTIVLEVEASDTVLSVKMHIQTTEDITPNQQHLHLLGYDAFLLNDHTLSEYQIQDGAMLYLMTSCCRQIYVRTWDDETVILDVVPRDSIAFVKAMVAVEKGILVN